jgi:ABC-2 type transport system permease protein
MPNSPRNVLLIARREYLEQIRGRAFLFSTVLLPLLIVGGMAASYFFGRKAGTGAHIAIVAQNGALANQVRREMLFDTDAKYTVDVVTPASPENRAALLQRLNAKSIDGILSIDSSSSGAITASYTSLASVGFANIGAMQDHLNRGIINERLLAGGMKPDDVAAALKWVPIETLQLNKEGKAGKSSGIATFYKSFVLLLLLSLPIMLYGLDMARSIIEEKSSRIFEVMLAVARPDDLLTGKMVGVGAVGLTQIAIWVLAFILVLGSSLAAPLLSGDFSLHISWTLSLLFPVYFVLGFALFSAVFSGLAATCETSQDLQKFMPLAIIPLYMGMAALPLLMKDPNSVWSIAASLFPLTSPYVMLPRVELQMPPIWQIGASIGLLLLAIWGALWLSSRLYRIGILMYGKRATLPELLRWLRYS